MNDSSKEQINQNKLITNFQNFSATTFEEAKKKEFKFWNTQPVVKLTEFVSKNGLFDLLSSEIGDANTLYDIGFSKNKQIEFEKYEKATEEEMNQFLSEFGGSFHD